MQQRVRGLAWLEPMDTLEIAELDFCTPPSGPFRLHANEEPFVRLH